MTSSGQISTALAFAIGSSFLSSHVQEVLFHQYKHSFYAGASFAGMAAVIAILFVRPVEEAVRIAEGDDFISLSG